jgi:hypothetical protein
MRTIETEEGSVIYLNSGDWVENLTALEYVDETWSLFQYNEFIPEGEKAEDKPVRKKKKKHPVHDGGVSGREKQNGRAVEIPV